MSTTLRCQFALLIVAGIVAGFLCPGTALAQNGYVIGTDDVLEISFWQVPDLNDQVRVGQDGKITLDIIGQIEAAGKTTESLEADIVRQISRLNKNVSQAVVRVIEFNHNFVFVIGQIRNPGKRSYERIPGLWELINEAGGVNEVADLSRVLIIRGGEDAGKVEVVNVQKAVAEGRLDKLPAIRRTDTIEIPRTVAATTTPNLTLSTERKNLIYVIGAVTVPGAKTYEDGLDILDALALAGGPTPDADLKKARILLKDGHYAQTITVDLEKYTSSGRPARYILGKEDTFVLPRKDSGFLGVGVPAVATAVGVITSVLLVVDRLTSE